MIEREERDEPSRTPLSPRVRTSAHPSLIRGRDRWRGGLLGELSLALPPTFTVLLVIVLIQGLTHERLLFASLASSAFLIYYDPLHRMNTVRIMVSSQLLACVLGIGFTLVLGAGYVAAGCAMTAAILLCVLFDIVHPPAISTALAFAFTSTHPRTVVLFGMALVLIASLVVVQRIAVWTVHFISSRKEPGS